ncbi:S-adenosyl-L-methionine-dependent methyltransferase [Trametes maxima]|nr:S-adenosyl-L-methionine-dependent methyltransferase [Trametes maxima]
MAVPTTTNDESEDTYAFQPANGVPKETARLDELHAGITEFFGGGLSLADLSNFRPSRILEIGSGSGAWAIQAARTYPEASVQAIDLNPIPPRPIPSNLHWQKADITQPFPFEDESFDIVHARLVMMHVPNGEDVLRRAVRLVKPGGWLFVEDPDDDRMLDGGAPLPPGMAAFVGSWLRIVRGRGAEPSIGREHGRILNSFSAFEDVHVRKVAIPISGKSHDPALKKLGLTWKVNMVRVAADLPQRFAADGITEEVAQQHLSELQDTTRNITTDFYFSFARKHRV